MFSNGMWPAPNLARAMALNPLRNCVSHMSGRMQAVFRVYPTIRMKFERKCICLYIQNDLPAVAGRMCIPYRMHWIFKKVHTLLYIQNAPPCQSPCRQQNMHTHAYAFHLKKVHTLPYIPILPAAVRRERQNAVLQAGQGLLSHCGVQGQRPCAHFTTLPFPIFVFAGNASRCRAQARPAGHKFRCRAHKKQRN